MSSHLVFSFGTLLDPSVQQHLFGREIEPRPASLAGHGLVDVPITDPEVVRTSGKDVHHGLARRVDETVEGALLELNDAELAAADVYEVPAYARRRVLTTSGARVWAYVSARPLAVAERIGVVGDSIAYGRSDPSGGWAARLAAHHVARDEARNRLFNLAYPGASLADVAWHGVSELAERRADTALIAAGLNDLAEVSAPDEAGTPDPSPDQVAEELLSRVAGLCHRLQGRGIRPVLVAPTWVDEDRARTEFGMDLIPGLLPEYRSILLGWTQEAHIDLLDPWAVLANRSELLSDGVHPVPEGHELLGQWVIEQTELPD